MKTLIVGLICFVLSVVFIGILINQPSPKIQGYRCVEEKKDVIRPYPMTNCMNIPIYE